MRSDDVRAVRVFILAPALIAWGFERLVQSAHPHLELAGVASNAPAARALMDTNPTDVVVVLLECEEDLAGLSLVHAQGRAKCLVVTAGANGSALVDKAMLAGARGVVKTWEAPAFLPRAIEKIHEGELWIDRSATTRIFLEMARQKASEGSDPEKTKIATLTSRERQAVAAVAGNVASPAKVIARKLCISEHTLRNHLTSIYAKLEVSNRLDLYAYATRHHLNELR